MSNICCSTDADTTAAEFLADMPAGVIDHGNGVVQVFADNGAEVWYKNNEIHRDGDLPAVVQPDGTQ